MAKKIIHTCDNCSSDSRETEAKPTTISINQLTRNVDLCDECGKQLLDPLIDLLRNNGVAGKSMSGPVLNRGENYARPTVCPMCGVDRASHRVLANHLRMGHRVEIPDSKVETIYGHACPLHPDCSERHKSTYDIWRKAFDANDPYGVIASNLERLNTYRVQQEAERSKPHLVS